MGDCDDDRGNCTRGSDDGLPVQCVGEWVPAEKHAYVRRYIEATYAFRDLFLPPAGKGGAGYVELFAGPGRGRVRERNDVAPFVKGSPFIALDQEKGAFTSVVLCEKDPVNADALTIRTREHADRVRVIVGDCNDVIDRVIANVPTYGLNLALVDPYGLKSLRFETLQKLARVKRMDLILHFPTGTIKRNLGSNPTATGQWIDRFLGTDVWRQKVTKPHHAVLLIDVLREQLVASGYTGASVRSVAIENSAHARMYHLVFVSKHPRADQIWDSLIKKNEDGRGGQLSLLSEPSPATPARRPRRTLGRELQQLRAEEQAARVGRERHDVHRAVDHRDASDAPAERHERAASVVSHPHAVADAQRGPLDPSSASGALQARGRGAPSEASHDPSFAQGWQYP